MNQKFFNVLMFTTGAAIGSLVTWKVVKTKYERIIEKEIESVKEVWSRMAEERASESVDSEDECADDGDDESVDNGPKLSELVTRYHEIVNRYKTSEEGDGDDDEDYDDEVPYINGPVVITPEEFADGNFDHDLYCLTYYSDGILADDWYVRKDVEETIGDEFEEHFGDHTEDVVHIRNERLKADFEVTRDPRRYVDVVANDPQLQIYAR